MKLFLLTKMKERTLEGFGSRLADIRQSKGLSQVELAIRVGVSNRVIHYYEQKGAQPQWALLVDLAQALGVSMDELLGLKPHREKTSPRTARLLKQLQRVENLPTQDQRAVLKYLDALFHAHGATQPNGSQRRARK